MKRMKGIATGLLILVLIGALAAWPFRHNFWGGLAFAAFEAALVGALADWFAVVALFRHPLNLRFIPHTAVISNNRERIINTITDVVENQWFNVDLLKQKIVDFPMVDKLSALIQGEAWKGKVEEFTASLIKNVLRDMKTETMAQFLQEFAAEHLAEIRISSEMVGRLEEMAKDKYVDPFLDFCLDKAMEATAGEPFTVLIQTALEEAVQEYSSRGGFWRRFSRGLGEGLDIINYPEAAKTSAKKIREVLWRMKQPENEYRLNIRAMIDSMVLADPEKATRLLQSLVQRVVCTDEGMRITEDLLTAVKEQMLRDDLQNSALVKRITGMLLDQIESVRTDEAKKEQIENWIKNALIMLVDKYHGIVGMIVKENLQMLNDESFVESLEDKVGDDLQWIRVNGTVIGSLVGIVQYLALHFI